jgi:hypothetical protein
VHGLHRETTRDHDANGRLLATTGYGVATALAVFTPDRKCALNPFLV